MMSNNIGIKRAEIVKDNQRIIYDGDDVKVENGILYTEKYAYDIIKQESLNFGSYRYFVNDRISGGNKRKKIVIGKLKGMPRFLTGKRQYDLEIMKLAKREYKKENDLYDIDDAEIEYNYGNVDEEIRIAQNELKELYTSHKTKQPITYTKEEDNAAKRVFGVDYSTFERYKNEVVGAKLSVEDSDDNLNEEDRMDYELFGGCECDLPLFEDQKYEVIKLKGGKKIKNTGISDMLKFIEDQIEVGYKYEESPFLASAINITHDKLEHLEDIKIEGGNVGILHELTQEEIPKKKKEEERPKEEEKDEKKETDEEKEESEKSETDKEKEVSESSEENDEIEENDSISDSDYGFLME